MTPPDDQARRFLDTDPVNHAKALESLRRHTGRIVAQSRAGVVVHDGPSDTFLIMTAADPARPKTEAPVDDLVARLHPVAVHQCEVFPAAAAPLVGRRFHLVADAHYVMAVARSGWRRGADDVPGVALVPVSPRSPDLELYPQSGRAYARTRADAGTLWAARLDGRAVGFIGTHDDGSIGLLQVLPPWRRRGIGAMLLSLMVERVLTHAPLACFQIDVDNAPSIRLHRRVGMLVGTRITAWLAEPDAAWAP